MAFVVVPMAQADLLLADLLLADCRNHIRLLLLLAYLLLLLDLLLLLSESALSHVVSYTHLTLPTIYFV